MIHPTRHVQRWNRTIVAAVRFVGTLLKESSMQPLLTALLASFVLGIIPMAFTALYSIGRALAGWQRHSARLRRGGTPIGTHFDQLTNSLELL